MDAPTLHRTFLTAAGRDPAVDAPERWERALRELVDVGARAWPDLGLQPAELVRHVGARLATDPTALEAACESFAQGTVPDTLQVADLHLACACARGQSGAIERFERLFAAEIGGVVARFANQGSSPEDLRQILRERLFVAHGDRPARIVEYRGTGTLRAWLRVTAVRAFLDEKRRMSRREKEEVGVAEPLLDLPSGEDWELDFLKQHYREAFRQAFTEAVSTLTSEQRNLLRFHAVEGLSIDQIGAVYSMHRSSVARRLQSSRKALLDATRAALMRRVRVERTELESIMGLIRSRLDVSLARLLSSGAHDPEASA